MKIAVIVSTYNRPNALVKVLNGLLNQSRLPDEIIVADDGSTTETKTQLKNYLNHDRVRLKHVWQEDNGFRLAEIRNKAIIASSADYLVFLDGDCIPGRHFVHDHLALAKEGCFFQGKRVIVSRQATEMFSFNDTTSFLKMMWYSVSARISNAHHIVRMPFLPAYTTKKLSGIRGCNMGFFKKDLIAVNGFNTAFVGWGREDTEIVVRLFKYGVKRQEHPFRAICYHLWHPENQREDLIKNDQRLEEAKQSNVYYCREGIQNR